MSTICKCPKCGGEIEANDYSYKCKECEFKCSKNIWGVEVTEDMIKDICSGKLTDKFTFKKPDKEWTAHLAYSKEKEAVVFEFDKPVVIGKCPVCGGDVIERDRFYLCKNYKDKCNTLIGKEISGSKISKEDAIKLLNGETLDKREFTWKSGKSGFAKLHLKDGKTEFIFE